MVERDGHYAGGGVTLGNAIGQVLPLAVGVAVSPIPIIAVVLMLMSARARLNGPVFVLGWLAGLAVIGVIVLAIAGPADASSHGQPATWVSVLKLVLGLQLILVAVRQWRGRPRPGHEATEPKWMDSVEHFSPAKAAGAGVVLSGANPKNLVLAIAAAAAIAQTGIGGADQAIAYIVFALIATVGVAAPVVMYFVLGDRSERILTELREWMAQHNAVIMAVICLIIGVKLIGDAISGFSM
jgi:Sap, sulfolipid-1-addressing protein